MEVVILASGSGGNCIAVRSGNTTILIDAGIPKTKIERRLLEAGIRPDEIDGIFLTHAHKDHVQGLSIANKYRINVYASEGTWKAVKTVDPSLAVTIDHQQTYQNLLTGMVAWAFRTYHDDFDSFGFVFEHGGRRLSICLDTGRVDDDMLEAMAGSDIYIIEANHDPDMLLASDYQDSVKERILSDRGHLSNQQAAAALSRLVKGRGEQIYLTHLSRKSNLAALARMTVEKALRRLGYENGRHYHLEVV